MTLVLARPLRRLTTTIIRCRNSLIANDSHRRYSSFSSSVLLVGDRARVQSDSRRTFSTGDQNSLQFRINSSRRLFSTVDSVDPCIKMGSAGEPLEFPKWALLPKRETQASSFLAKYPNFDGRGVVIAIMDSGVDPTAPGLQTTTDGKPKVIDIMDCSGAGDVDTSKVVKPNENGEITGLSGRTLKIPSSWTNPSGEYHIGLKNLFQLYTKVLSDRAKNHFQEKVFEPEQSQALAAAERELNALTKKLQDEKSELTLEQKLELDELKSRVEVLSQVVKERPDVGPSYDCLVWYDGDKWRAVVDSSETGDLSQCTVLGTYRETLSTAQLNPVDHLNYGVNIHNDGNTLEIVGYCSSHGTHVASIAAAHFPDDPERNGVAPGAQIISCTIGDNRLGSMETITALERALSRIVKSGVDVINMSYGERSHVASGRVLELFDKVVNKYGVTYVVSAGNAGPALTTVGTPPLMPTTSAIGIGAYVSPAMMMTEYSMRDTVPECAYTWSSRGPKLDGDIGVSVCAPGAAITSVPTWCLKNSFLMNGTSMAAPNATGSIALLMSGLRQNSLAWSPFSIKRALQNTARQPPSYDVFCMGNGLIQIEAAYDLLVKTNQCPARDVRFHVDSAGRRGIYLREKADVERPSVISLNVEPFFLDNTDPSRNPLKQAFNINLRLVCDVPWVSTGKFMSMSFCSRPLGVKIDPTNLPPGVHYTTIRAYNVETSADIGPLFEIPITVIKPEEYKKSPDGNFSPSNAEESLIHVSDLFLKPGQLVKRFVAVPYGMSTAHVKVTNKSPTDIASFVLHALQLVPQRSSRSFEWEKFFSVSPGHTAEFSIPIREERTLELCLGKWWSSFHDVLIDWDVKLYGLKPRTPVQAMLTNEGIHRTDVQVYSYQDEMNPSVSLKELNIPLRPTDSKISPLTSRDVLPEGKQLYETVLTYSLNVPKATDVTITCPMLGDTLYECDYDSQLVMVYDSNKKLCITSDAYAKAHKYSAKLEKGDYTIRMQVKHDKKAMLEKLSDLALVASLNLPTALSVDVYPSLKEALTGGKKFNTVKASRGQCIPLYFASTPSDKLPKGLNYPVGSFMSGTLKLSKNDSRKSSEHWPFKYIICSEVKKKGNSSDSNSSSSEKELSPEEQDIEQLMNTIIAQVPKLKSDGYVDKMIALISKTLSPDRACQMKMAQIQFLESKKDASPAQIIHLADEVISLIPFEELLAESTSLDNDKVGELKEKPKSEKAKSVERRKDFLIEALARKGAAICRIINSAEAAFKDTESERTSAAVTDEKDRALTIDYSLADVDKIYTDLLSWVDFSSSTDAKIGKFLDEHAALRNQRARRIRLILRAQSKDEKAYSKENELKLMEHAEKLGWPHVATLLRRGLPVRFPPDYQPF